MDLCTSYFFPLLDNAVVLVRDSICGKATQLSSGKSERQLCIPSLVPPKSLLSSLLWSPTFPFPFCLCRFNHLTFFNCFTLANQPHVFVSFKTLDIFLYRYRFYVINESGFFNNSRTIIINLKNRSQVFAVAQFVIVIANNKNRNSLCSRYHLSFVKYQRK